MFLILTVHLTPRFFSQCGVLPLDSKSAVVFELDLIKNTETFRSYFSFINSITDNKRCPNFFEQRPLFSQETTFWLSVLIRISDEGE